MYKKSYKDLEIYISLYNLSKTITNSVLHMRKDVKMLMGGALLEWCDECSILVYKANSERDLTKRVVILDSLLEILQKITFKIRLCKDMRNMSLSSYAKCVELLADVENQSNSWKTWCNRQARKEGRKRPLQS